MRARRESGIGYRLHVPMWSTGGGREAVSLSVTRAARQVLVLTYGERYRTTRLERS